MPSIERADPVIMGHILAEHREFFDLLSSARGAFADALGGRAENAATRLGERLSCLRDHLQRHFSSEERGGYLEEASTRMPRLAADVKAVLAEHPVLLAQLDALIAEVSSSATVPQPRDLRTLEREFDEFSRNLVNHERTENAVVQAGYNEDLGLAD